MVSARSCHKYWVHSIGYIHSFNNDMRAAINKILHDIQLSSALRHSSQTCSIHGTCGLSVCLSSVMFSNL